MSPGSGKQNFNRDVEGGAFTLYVCPHKLELCVYWVVRVDCGFGVCVGVCMLALCVQRMMILCGWVSVGCTGMCVALHLFERCCLRV